MNLVAQENTIKVLSLEEAVRLAITNNPKAKNAALTVDAAQARKSGSILFNPTQVSYGFVSNNSSAVQSEWIISQNFGSPLTHFQRSRLYQQQLNLAQINRNLSVKLLTATVKESYFRWVYQFALQKLMKEELGIYEGFLQMTRINSDSGTVSMLEKTMAEAKYAASQKKLLLANESIKLATNDLNRSIYSEEAYLPAQQELEMYAIQFNESQGDKFYPYSFKALIEQHVKEKKAELELERSRLVPEISAGYFNERVTPMKNMQGWQLGLAVPLWVTPLASRIKEAKINLSIAQNEATQTTYELEQSIDDLKIKLDQQFIAISYFREEALKQAETLLNSSSLLFGREEIHYTEYLQNIFEALQIKEDYLNSLLQYNLLAIELEYLLN